MVIKLDEENFYKVKTQKPRNAAANFFVKLSGSGTLFDYTLKLK